MKTLYPFNKRFLGFLSTVLGSAMFFAASSIVPAHAVTVTNQNGADSSAPANQTMRPPYAPAVSEIVKLFDAGVDKTVIVAYVNNSSTGYRLTASEIIALKDHGVSSEIIAVMLQHNTDLRTQQGSNQSPSPAYNQGPVATAPYTPQSAYPAYPAYDYSYPDYGYAYPYSYGGYYDYWWPWYGASFSLGFYPFYPFHGFHHDFDHFHHHFGGHDGFHAFGPGTHSGGPVHAGFSSGGRSGFFIGGNAGRSGGFAVHGGGFGGRSAGFSGHSGGFGGHGGGSHGGGRR